MTFAGNFFTEDRVAYNVVQIVVKTMTALSQGKVHCSEQDQWQNHSWNEWLHRLSMLYVCTNNIFFCHLSKDTTITPFL